MLVTSKVKVSDWSNFSTKVKVNDREPEKFGVKTEPTNQPGGIVKLHCEQSWTPDWENWGAGLKT